MITITKTVATITLLGAALCFSGCVAIGNREPSHAGVTLGQELMDLQKARDTGAISESEYQTQRARLMGTNVKH